MYARFINPFGSFAVGDATERKKAAGIRIVAIGAPVGASQLPKGRKGRLVNVAKHDQRQNEIDAGVGVPGAPEIVPQRIVGIARRISRQKTEKRQASVHHCGKNDEEDSPEHSRFS